MDAGGSSNDRRRAKAALYLLACLAAGMAPHWLPPAQSFWPAIAMAVLLGGYSIRTVLLQSFGSGKPGTAALGEAEPPAAMPAVDVVVAARDEQAVVTRLVEHLARLRYPEGSLRIWVVDDGSTDRTPELLSELQQRFGMLQVVRRAPESGGGKSGALNQVLQQLQGRWLLVLDADAQLQVDTLERLIPFAEAGGWSAVQLRKAVANPQINLLTKAQAMEMALDAVMQQGRLAAGGIAELRGNGQLLKREAVLACGGFNEATVTDDLDLSFRLLVGGESIGVLWDPPVQEEAVLSLRALLRQRQRWAEGGLQRFFDYGAGLISRRLKPAQQLDLLCFFLLQYVMPVLAIADLIGALVTGTLPCIWPLSIVALGLSGLAIVRGCLRPSEGPPLPAMNPLAMALGIVYLGHWFVVIPWVSLRMAIFPKRLIWAKTLHLGDGDDADGEAAATA